MKRKIVGAILLFFCFSCASGFVPVAAEEESVTFNIATIDNRPLFIDRMLYTAFRDIGCQAFFSVSELSAGYRLASNGEIDGVIAGTPNMDKHYPNLIQIPVKLDNTYVYALTRKAGSTYVTDWDSLSGKRIGILSNRVYISEKLAGEDNITVKETNNQLINGLAEGEYDVAVMAVRSHETFLLPEPVQIAAQLECLPEYLYLNSKRSYIADEITRSLRQMESDGRMESILNDTFESTGDKTILQIISSSQDNPREEMFTQSVRDMLTDGDSVEWYTVELMTRRFTAELSRMSHIGQLLRWDCLSRNIAAIFVSGDDALTFIKEYYFRYFRNTPVFFYGVNGSYEDAVRYFEPYFTGINVSLPALETVEQAMKLFPDRKTLYVVNDYTTEGLNFRAAIERQLEPLEGVLDIQYNGNADRDSLLADIQALPADGMVLCGSYFRDAGGRYYAPNEMRRFFSENCDVPVFSPFTTELAYNAIGGYCLDYSAYGKVAGEWLRSVLSGEATVRPDPDPSKYAQWVFNKESIDAYGIKEQALPAGSVLLNKTPGIWETDPLLLIGTIALLVALSLLAVCMAVFLVWSRKQKEIELKEVNLQKVLDSLPFPIRIVKLQNNTITYINYAAAALFGLASTEKALGRSPDSFMPPEQPDGSSSSERLMTLHHAGRLVSDELLCMNEYGGLCRVHYSASPIDYQGSPSSLIVLKDVTAEKEYENILLSAIEREREANQLKSSFLSNMSHEIRTPMNAIIGLTELELRRELPDDIYEVYKKISVSAKNLLQIINDILDLSKIEADKMELVNERFELEDVLNSALLVVSPRLEGKHVEMLLNAQHDLPRYLIGDGTRLWQILKNFLDNSAKFTETGKIILDVSLNPNIVSGDKLAVDFVVRDTGIGLDKEEIDRLFLPYEQTNNELQKRYKGTGLGMSIAKNLCELMGGTLRVEGERGVGTTVYISIPFERSHGEDAETLIQQSSMLEGIRVLAVDDDGLALEIMSKLLTSSGAVCEVAHSGEQAVEFLVESSRKGEDFDMILLDYYMDGINGLETAKRIHMSLAKVPKLLMVTAYQKLLLKNDLEQSGIDDILEKPLIPSKFVGKLLSALGLSAETQDKDIKAYEGFDNARVLICEDNPINQEVAAGVLAQFGVKSVIADNGKEGLIKLRQEGPFDLVLMDLHMPVMDGFEASRAIRADGMDIPIISLSADAMTEVKDKCVKAGMNDFIVKPIDFEDVYNALLTWLPKKEHR